VGRETHGQPERPNGLDRKIVLPYMDVVGLDDEREIGSVVHDERNPETACDGSRLLEHGQEPSIVERLLTNLDGIDATFDRRHQKVGQIGPGAGDEIETAVREHA
jgi:hypothetical protein